MGLRIYYGGTFDPVHLGHLAIARAARDQLQVAVRLLPAADPPHRAAPGADAAQRLAMLALAIGDEPGLLLDRRELDRAERQPGVPSYTVDTLRELRAELGPRQPIAWLVGADSLLALPSWH
ncbi:MAG: nicotinate-nicotinamide nucleotide adenylyltransferase, partial [Stenotrophomonas sp.]